MLKTNIKDIRNVARGYFIVIKLLFGIIQSSNCYLILFYFFIYKSLIKICRYDVFYLKININIIILYFFELIILLILISGKLF